MWRLLMIDNFGYESTKGLTLVMEKHQDHDQQSHGNWANLSGKELVADWESSQNKRSKSPANPKGTNSQALRSWVEGPYRNFSRNYPIQDILRHIMHGTLGLPLTPYKEVYSDKQRYIDERTLNSQSKNLLESLDNAPKSQPVLWRGQNEGMQEMEHAEHGGLGYEKLLNLKVGDEFVSPMFSSSRDADTAYMYATHGLMAKNPASVVFRIEAGAKGLRTNIIEQDSEVLTGGKFRVNGVADSTIGRTYVDNGKVLDTPHPLRIISLIQEDTFGIEDYAKERFLPDSQYRVGRR